jgi:two-component system alkaline phosphatase synthesis response regulator PhoP
MGYRIAVVDDDRQIVRAICSYLENAGMVTYPAYEGDGALHLLRHERPDLVVLDLMLPGKDGWEIARQIRADRRLSSIAILMLTARVEDSDKMFGFELGADDYLTKPFNPPEVVARVKAILRRARGTPAVPHILQVGDLRLDVDYHVVSVADRPVDVTPTEFVMLQLLMENPNHVFSRTALVQRVLGYAYEGMERTIDAHVKNLRKKVETDPAQPQLIETIYGVGYCLREEAAKSNAH